MTYYYDKYGRLTQDQTYSTTVEPMQSIDGWEPVWNGTEWELKETAYMDGLVRDNAPSPIADYIAALDYAIANAAQIEADRLAAEQAAEAAAAEQARLDAIQYWYDGYGWLSETEIAGRLASCAPPAHGDKVVGDAYPNWTGVEWVLATYSEPPPPPEPVIPVEDWYMYVGPFYDRFGQYKLPILASTDPLVMAIIKDSAVRKFIDLTRTDIPQMLDILISKGFAVDKDAILHTLPNETEKYKGAA